MRKQLIKVGLSVEGLDTSVEAGYITQADADQILIDAEKEVRTALSGLSVLAQHDYELYTCRPWAK